jgi:hypothetical protein
MRCRNRANEQITRMQQEQALKEWRKIRVTLDSLPELAEIPAEVRALIAEHLNPNEVIDSMDGAENWSVDDEVLCVHLIDKDNLAEVAPIRRRFHMGGSGRTLEFGRRGGKWVFLDEGGWIS